MPRRDLGNSLWTSYVRQQRESAHSLRRNQLKQAGETGRWRRWKAAKAIEDQIPTVNRIARTESRKFAPHLDLRDLVQQGMVGLMEASRRYKPGAGGFGAFAYFRIRGSIIDAHKRRAYLEETHSSLEAPISNSGWANRKQMTVAETVACSARPVDEEIARSQAAREVNAAVATLGKADRLLLRAWMEGKTLREQCRISGMSQNYTRDRITQLQARVRVAIEGMHAS